MSIRSYHQICSVARALDLIGERWTMLIVRDLMIGPMRYSDLLASLPGITTNLLAKRLKTLQEREILEKKTGTQTQGAAGSRSSLYALTDKGRALEPVLKALGEWGLHHGRPPCTDDQLNPRWLLFFLRRLYQKPRRKALIELRIQDRSFQFQIGGTNLEILEDSPLEPDLRVSGSPQAFMAFFTREKALSDLLKSQDLEVEGSPKAREVFLQSLGLSKPHQKESREPS